MLKIRRTNERTGSNIIHSDVIVEVPKHEEESERAKEEELEEDPEFRVYSDNEDKTSEGKNDVQPPGYLVKVVNQFEDYDNN